jgi:hypothetical protein
MRATFFALSALSFYAFAQYPVPDAAPTASESTSTSQAFIPPVIDTSKEVPVDLHPTSSDDIVVPKSMTETVHVNPETTAQLPPVVQESTTQQAIGQGTTAQVPPVQDTTTGLPIVVDSSTRPAPVVDTTTSPVSVVGISTGSAPAIDTTQPFVQGTTTGPSHVVDTTTGTAPVIDTTQPIVQDATAQPIVQSTTTGQPIAADTTSKQQASVQPTTTELKPPNVGTTTWLPVGDTSNQPINQTPGSQTPPRGPVDHDTTREPQPPVDSTTTGVPPVETTTQQESVQDTTTVAGQPVKTTEESNLSTKDDEPATTQPPTTTAAAAATASVSSVSSQVAALIPIINKWTEDPESLTDETNKKVEDTHDDIIAVIVGLGGKPDIACNKKRGLGMRRLKRRGLLGPIGDVISKLACMAQDLAKISSNIIAGNVPAVTSVIPEVKSQNDDLTEEEENKGKESKESTTEKPTSTEESTTTEATTTTTSETIVCASGSCGGGSCPVGLGSGGSMPKRMHSIPRDIKCQDIPTTTIDGPLSTGPISLGGSKRDKGLKARMFFDGDMSPNPHYIDGVSMNPETTWDDQSGLTTGHFVGAPLDDGWSAAGVNGIYGCTAVLIVSNVGVYTSHIWEVPGFLELIKSPHLTTFLRPMFSKSFAMAP